MNSRTRSRVSSTLLLARSKIFCIVCTIWWEILHALEQLGNPTSLAQEIWQQIFRALLKKGIRMFRNLRNIRTHSSLLVERSRWETTKVVELIAWISCTFLYRVRPLSALHKQSHAVACLEYAVIGTLEVLLLYLCHLRWRYSAHRRVILRVDEYHQAVRA